MWRFFWDQADSSRKVLAVMIFYISFLLFKGFWVAKDFCFRAGDNKKYRRSGY